MDPVDEGLEAKVRIRRIAVNRLPLGACPHGGFRSIPDPHAEMRRLGSESHSMFAFPKFCLGFQALGDVVDGQKRKESLTGANGIETDLNRNPRPVLAAAEQLASHSRKGRDAIREFIAPPLRMSIFGCVWDY